jgi:hypothetical protein
MRKIYFLIFAIVLVALILLVDWREKLQQITRSQPGERLGQILTSSPEPALSGEEERSGEALPNEAFPDVAYEEPAAAELMPSSDPGFSDLPVSRPGGARTSAGAVASSPLPLSPQPFQDLQEQPYRDESRRALRNTIANYNRIRPPVQPEAKPERRP